MARDKTNSTSDLLQEIRNTFDYEVEQWKDIRDEGSKDMRAIAGDPWDPKDRREREGAGRLVLSLDEVNQYCNQLINDVRQNKRAVKVLPRGLGASDFTALRRGAMMRQIDYDSKAQAAYRTAFEGVVQRSYGAWKYKTAYVSDSAFEQEIRVVRIPNPNTIYMDWDAKEADYSDAGHAFEIDTIGIKEFRRRWPHAERRSFDSEDVNAFPKWIKSEERLQIASYWKVHREERELVLWENGRTDFLDEMGEGVKLSKAQMIDGQKVWLAEIPGLGSYRVLNRRKTETQTVVQYVTNGVEILQTNEWPGKYIPIVFITGKEIYVDDGAGGEKRKLLSLVRLAREPYMTYCYLWTAQVEAAQQVPKSPLMGAEGQFDTTTDWPNIHKTLTPFIEYKALTKETKVAANGGPQQLLPPPTWRQFAADIQSIEVMKESARRAIQSAMGITGMLNGTNQTAEAKSGIALRTLDQQESTGNFHFIDAYDGGLEFGGRICDDLLGPVYDSPRQVGMRTATGDHYTEPINQFDPMGQKIGFHTDHGDHGIEITTGPSFDSQRAEAQDFAESLTKIDPIVTRTILPEIVKLRNLGPIGDDIAKKLEALDPTKQQIPPAVQQQVQKLTALVQKLMQERQAKIVEQQGKAFIASAQQQVDLEKKRYDVIATITQALIKAGQETNAASFASQMENVNLLWEQMHEFTQAGLDRQHEKDLSAQEHQQDLQQIAAQPQPVVQPPAQA